MPARIAVLERDVASVHEAELGETLRERIRQGWIARGQADDAHANWPCRRLRLGGKRTGKEAPQAKQSGGDVLQEGRHTEACAGAESRVIW